MVDPPMLTVPIIVAPLHMAELPAETHSQPFAHAPSRSNEPPGQDVMPHRPAPHTAGAPPQAVAQLFPHVPQFDESAEVFASQPLAAVPSQLPNPALHAAIVQAPAAHPAEPLAARHWFAHVPQ